MSRRAILTSKRLLGALALAAFAAAARPVVAEPPDAAKLEAARRDFVEVARVLQSPRCMNCHPAGEAPLQTDKSIPHAMNISRKSNDSGLACATCHRTQNHPALHGPPGVPGWRLPPTATPMVFEKRPLPALCAQLKDPAQNGGKSLQALFEHMDHDPLVMWGWAPGGGRTLPPLTHAAFSAHARAWIDAGAPCPL